MHTKRPKIKICGLRRPQDAEFVNEFPISYVGFVFAKSKRRIDIATALEIKKRLRGDIKTAGVFADMSIDEVRFIADSAGLDIVQLHSDEDNDFCRHFKDKIVWKSIAVADEKALGNADLYEDCGFVLDAYDKELRGGTGRSFKWELAADFAKNHFTVLAGGISSDNIIEAAEIVKPDVIDLSSSLETEGFKDYNKIKELFEVLYNNGLYERN